MRNLPRSDSWHRLGWHFALASIHTYRLVASGRRVRSLWPALSFAGVARSRPDLPRGRYQGSLGHPRLFPPVSPAHPVVRWGGTIGLRLHSAGSTIPQLWPTGSSLGELAWMTTRWFSASPSAPTSRWTPCFPKCLGLERWRQVGLGCVQLSLACPLRRLQTFLLLRPVRHDPHLWISARGPGPSGT